MYNAIVLAISPCALRNPDIFRVSVSPVFSQEPLLFFVSFFTIHFPRLRHCVDSEIVWCAANTHMGHHIDSVTKCTVRNMWSYFTRCTRFVILATKLKLPCDLCQFWWGAPVVVVVVVHRNIRTNQSDRTKAVA